jgi:cobalt-zinc-cadmium efflux system membrane fusion protein
MIFPFTNQKITRGRKTRSNAWLIRVGLLPLLLAVSCGHAESEHLHADELDHEAESELRGPNGGLLLRRDGFELELGIFESGLPPEYRAWAKVDDQPIDS